MAGQEPDPTSSPGEFPLPDQSGGTPRARGKYPSRRELRQRQAAEAQAEAQAANQSFPVATPQPQDSAAAPPQQSGEAVPQNLEQTQAFDPFVQPAAPLAAAQPPAPVAEPVPAEAATTALPAPIAPVAAPATAPMPAGEAEAVQRTSIMSTSELAELQSMPAAANNAGAGQQGQSWGMQAPPVAEALPAAFLPTGSGLVPEQEEPKRKSRVGLVLIIVGVLVALGLVATVAYLLFADTAEEIQIAPTPTSQTPTTTTPTPSETVTETPETPTKEPAPAPTKKTTAPKTTEPFTMPPNQPPPEPEPLPT